MTKAQFFALIPPNTICVESVCESCINYRKETAFRDSVCPGMEPSECWCEEGMDQFGFPAGCYEFQRRKEDVWQN